MARLHTAHLHGPCSLQQTVNNIAFWVLQAKQSRLVT